MCFNHYFWTFQQEFERETSFKGLYKTTIPLFTVKCLELCWLMNMHNPPVALGLPPAKDSPFDGTFYKEYTRTGTTVDFVVWLPLLLHKNGPLLQKGVLQPNQSMARYVRQKAHSAQSNFSKSRGNKEQFDIGDPQADRLNIGGQKTKVPSVHGRERETDKYLYGNPYQQTVAGYQQNTASTSPNSQLAEQRTQNPSDAGTSHERGKYNHLYKSSKTSKGSTLDGYSSTIPLRYIHNGRTYVYYQGVNYTYEQWQEMENKFLSQNHSSNA